MRRLSRRVVEAYYVDAEARVRLRLVDLATTYGGDEPAAPVTLPLTQEEIAGLAGTSRATVNRVLRQEEGRGTLALGRGRTVLARHRRARPAPALTRPRSCVAPVTHRAVARENDNAPAMHDIRSSRCGKGEPADEE